MYVASGIEAWAQLFKNVRRKTFQMPRKDNSKHFIAGGIFPPLAPKFKFPPGSKIFTIGSCFARNVEERLIAHGFNVPVGGFEIPENELEFSGPHLLNEYNAGTIVQRLENSAGHFDYGDKGVEWGDKGVLDLFLHVGSFPITVERLRERRREIDLLYKELLTSDVVIITLGLVECWYDVHEDCYLNRAPSQAFVKSEPGRFEFRRMDIEDVHSRMRKAVQLLNGWGTKNILITVSPVPVEATFMPESCPIANGYSKAVLRVCAEQLSKEFDNVSYFPSFEIVHSFGSVAFEDDNTHVRGWVVDEIMKYLMANYVEGAGGVTPVAAAEPVRQSEDLGEATVAVDAGASRATVGAKASDAADRTPPPWTGAISRWLSRAK